MVILEMYVIKEDYMDRVVKSKVQEVLWVWVPYPQVDARHLCSKEYSEAKIIPPRPGHKEWIFRMVGFNDLLFTGVDAANKCFMAANNFVAFWRTLPHPPKLVHYDSWESRY